MSQNISYSKVSGSPEKDLEKGEHQLIDEDDPLLVSHNPDMQEDEQNDSEEDLDSEINNSSELIDDDYEEEPNYMMCKAPTIVIAEEFDYKFYDFGTDKKAKAVEVTPSVDDMIAITHGFFNFFAANFKSLFSKKDSNEPKPNQSEIEKQFKGRKRIRYCCVIFIPLLILFIFGGLCIFTRKTDEFAFPIINLTDININASNTLIMINQDKTKDVITGSYYVTYSIFSLFNETSEQSSFDINYDEETNVLNISIISVFENIKSSRLFINLPKNLSNNLNIQCIENCFVIQEYNTLQVNKLLIHSKEDVYTNFRRVNADELIFQADKGIFQLNSFTIKNQASVTLKYGNIVLQSEHDIKLDWKNQQQAFCFASPYVTHQNIQDCYIAGDEITAQNQKLNTCKGQTSICANQNCNSTMPTFKINQDYGNLYANRLEAPFVDIEYVKDYKVSKGGIYQNGVAFESHTLATLEEAKAHALEVNTDTIFILELGRKNQQSQGSSFWTVISNPSYVYLRPWWLSTFSLSLLTGNSYKITGNLSPGICPYHIEYNIEDIYLIQDYMQTYFNLSKAIVSYIDETYEVEPNYPHKNGTGFFNFENDRPISEQWFSIDKDEEANLVVTSNDIDKNGFILSALILSFTFAAFVGITVVMIFKVAIMLTYKEIIELSNHTKNYKSMADPKNNDKDEKKPNKKKFNIQAILEESSFYNFMREVPRLSAFVGFYAFISIKKYFFNSVDEFLSFLMNPNLKIELAKVNKGIGETQYIEMKEKNLKNYYEKFCFLNGLTEKQLSDNENQTKFNDYGFDLVDETDNLSQAFTKMQIYEKEQELDFSSIANQDPLELFINTCIQSTNSDTDTEYIDEFIEKFNSFCDKYRLNRKEVRADLITTDIKYKFGLALIPRKKLVRKIDTEALKKQQQEETTSEKAKVIFMKIITFGKYANKKNIKANYLIDETQLKFHFDLLMDKNNGFLDETKNSEEDLIMKKRVIDRMIYDNYWFNWVGKDVLLIFIQQLVTTCCIVPFFLLVLLEETSYSPYSIINPDFLVTSEDLSDNPMQILRNFGRFTTWNIVIVSICIFFMIYSFLDCLVYFSISSFPEERSFEQNQKLLKKNKIFKYLTNFQWILIFFIVFCYSSYIGLVCVWLLLGAIINPNNYLVYSTAAMTFLMFLTSKYQSFQKIFNDGFKTIKEEVFKILQCEIKKIISYMLEESKELSLTAGKDLQKSEVIQFAFAKADEMGLGEEIAKIKKLTTQTLRNPNNVANELVNDPDKLVEKIKKAEESLKNKAISIFKTNCKAHNIPENLIDLFLSLNFKNEDQIKENIALLVELKSKDVFGQKISKKLMKCILDIILPPKNVKDQAQLSNIVSQDIIINILEFFLTQFVNSEGKQTPENVDLSQYREIMLLSFGFVSSIKKKNKGKMMQNIKKIIKIIPMNPNDCTTCQHILDILEIMLTMKNESNFKRKTLKYLYDTIHDDDLFEFLSAMIFSSPDDKIQNIGKKTYTKSENLPKLFEKILTKYKASIKDPKLIAYLVSYFIKCMKNQVEPNDIEDTSEILSKFFIEVFEKFKLKGPSKRDMHKFLQIFPLFFYFGKENSVFLNDMSAKYSISSQQIDTIILLSTSKYWEHFHDTRIIHLSNSKTILIIAKKLKMKEDEILGFIAMYNESWECKCFEDMLNSLLDYEKTVFPLKIRNYSLKILNLIIKKNNGFTIYRLLNEMGVNSQKILDYLKNNNLIDEMTNKFFDLKYEIPINQQKPTDLDLKYIFTDMLEINGNLDEIILFFTRLKNLIELKNIPKNKIRRNIEIKNCIFVFAQKYKFEIEGLEFLIYIMMGDFEQSIKAYEYFLSDQQEIPFKKCAYEQILKTILNEDRMNKTSYFIKLIDKWLPEMDNLNDEQNNVFLENITMSFQRVLWFAHDVSKFGIELSNLEIDQNLPEIEKTKAIEEIRFKTFCLFHTTELIPDKICELFPIVNDINPPKEDEILLELDMSTNERLFDDEILPEKASEINDAKICIEKMKVEDKINFQKIFKMMAEMIVSNKFSLEDILENLVYIFFKNEVAENDSYFDWTDSDLIYKYVALFTFINNKIIIQLGQQEEQNENVGMEKLHFLDLQNFFKQNFSLNPNEPVDLNEFNQIMKYYFTTNSVVFAQGIIQYFNEFHHKSKEFADIFTMCTLNPSVSSLSAILNINTTEIDSVFNICRLFYSNDFKDKYKILFENQKWFQKLSINWDEFILLLQFITNKLNPYDFTKFINFLKLDKEINSQALQGLLCIFAKTDDYNNDFELFQKLSSDKSVVFRAIGINESFGELYCDINQGNFWNLKNIIRCNSILSEVKIFPKKNQKNIVEIISCFIGMISTDNRLFSTLDEVVNNLTEKILKPSNNPDTLCYLMLNQFSISPYLTLLSMGETNTKLEYKNMNESLDRMYELIFLALDKISLSELNRLSESEFLIYVLGKTTKTENLENKKHKNHFYNDLFKIQKKDSKPHKKSEESKEKSENVASKQKDSSKTLPTSPKEESKDILETEESQEEMAASELKNDSYSLDISQNRAIIGQILNNALLQVYNEKNIQKTDELYIAFDKTVEESINEVETYSDIYFKLTNVFEKLNILGPNENMSLDFGISKLIILSILKKLRGLYNKKNEDQSEVKPEDQPKAKTKIEKEKQFEEETKEQRRNEQNYNEMIHFGLNFDLLLTIVERIKFVQENYENFENFNKNALLKFLIPVLFFEIIEKQDDFILEFFFRQSLFENDVAQYIKQTVADMKGKNLSSSLKLFYAFSQGQFIDHYFSKATDKNIEEFIKLDINKLRTYEDLKNELERQNSSIAIHPLRKNMLDILINLKKNPNYLIFKYNSIQALEDYYPLNVLAESANEESILSEWELFKNNDFFSAENYIKIKEFPLLKRNMDFSKTLKFTEKLNGCFQEFQMIKSPAGKELLANILIFLKERACSSKKCAGAIELILAKLSFSLKSNYNNLTSFIDFILKKDLSPHAFENVLSNIDVDPWMFYGLAIPHLRMIPVLLSKTIGNCFKHVPDIITKILNTETIDQELEKISSNQAIRNLFQKSAFSKVQKDSLVILINCFCGDKNSWKKLLYEINAKGLAGTRDFKSSANLKENKDFEEFLELFEIFNDNMRKDYQQTLLNSRSIAEFINPTTSYRKFNKIYFDKICSLTDHDSNNLILIRLIIDRNYEIMLRLFNEAPNFLARKLNLHYNSQRYFSLKILLMSASLSKASIQVNPFILDYLDRNICDNPNIIRNVLGFDQEFFYVLKAAETGDFIEFLIYLVKKDERYLNVASLYCWFYLPHMVARLKKHETDYSNKKRVYLLLMFGIINVLNIFYQNNKMDLLKYKIVEKLKKYLIQEISRTMHFINLYQKASKISWLSLEFKFIWNQINQAFSSFIIDDLKEDINVVYDDIKNLFAHDFEKIEKLIAEYINENYLSENNPDNKYITPFIDFFPYLFYGTSGVAKTSSNMDELIKKSLNRKKGLLNNFFSVVLNIDEQKPNEKDKNQINDYQGTLTLIMVAIKIIEQNKNGNFSTVEESLKKIVSRILGQDKQDLINMIFNIIISSFGEDSVPDLDLLGKLLVFLLESIFTRVNNKQGINEGNVKKTSGKPEKTIDSSTDLKPKEDSFETVLKLNELIGVESPKILIKLIQDIIEYLQQQTINSNEIKSQQLESIALRLGQILFHGDKNNERIIESVFNFINQDFDKLSPEILNLFNIDKKTLKIVKGLLQEFQAVLQAPQAYINNKIAYLTTSLTGEKVNTLDIINEKLKMEKEMSSQDLFQTFDTDKSGRISLQEFKLLTNRLNMSLSDHRIMEIFTSVKGNEIKYSKELNEKEFVQALNYLQNKSIMLTLEYLGITKEVLFGVLVWLIVLLLILFAFIFVGITAFAIGGTFGSIINSLFPIAGGVGLGQKGEDKQSALNMEKLKVQVEKCVEIVQSFKI